MADPNDTVLFSPALSDEVLHKARDDIARFNELRQRALEGQTMPDAVNQGCDITLSHMGLATLPPELIDIVKSEVSRLALDHNRLTGLSGLSLRFGECRRLRYLVMRSNQLREFPLPILSVPTLELLDLKGNRIESIPEDLSKLSKLRVFSIHHNRVSRIPLCVGQMNSLVHFTTSRNPIVFPPTEEWMTTDMEPQKNDKRAEDARIWAETKALKSVLVEYSNRGKSKADGDGEMSEDNVETPRPARRKTSGRFPIKPSQGGPDLKALAPLMSSPLISPLPLKPPPIPSRSFARLPTQPQTATFRPTIPPIVTLSERNRSNSESQMSTTLRAKRMGVITRKPVAQNSLDLDLTKRQSHLRGLSHGSALQNGVASSAVTDSSSPASPVDADPQRAAFVRRLSSLPEGKRKSHTEDPLVDVARGILYALDQIHAPIQKVLRVLKDGKRNNLERTCQTAFSFTEELDRLLIKFASHDEENEEEERRKSSMSIRTSCETCIRAFEQLILALQLEVRTLVVYSNPLYIRTLMHLLYASLVELRNACSKLGVELQSTPRAPQRNVSRGRFLSPAPGRPLTSLRVRDHTPLLPGSRSSSRHGPHILPQRTIPLSAASRTGSMTSLASIATRPPEPYTPFSNGSMSTTMTRMTRSNTMMSVEEMEEEQQFERIFLKLSTAVEFAIQALPRCHIIVTESNKMAAERGASDADLTMCAAICDRCRIAIDAADALKKRLGTLKLKEPGVRVQLEFWHLCTAFIRAYTMFAARVKDCWHGPVSLIPDDVKFLLKPVQRSVKDVSKTINDSPWSHLAATPGQQPSSAPSKSSTNIAGMGMGGNTLTQQTHLYQPLHQVRNPNYSSTATTLNTSHRQQHPQLSLSTRGAPPPNPLDPLSATSTHSASGLNISSGYITPVASSQNTSFTAMPIPAMPPLPSGVSGPSVGAVGAGGGGGVTSGYVTPLPATPMSAALGPAAGVTVPLPVSAQLAALAGGGPVGGGGNVNGNLGGPLGAPVGLSIAYPGGGMNMSMGGLGGLLPSVMGASAPLQQGVNGGGVNVGSGLLPPTSTAGGGGNAQSGTRHGSVSGGAGAVAVSVANSGPGAGGSQTGLLAAAAAASLGANPTLTHLANGVGSGLGGAPGPAVLANGVISGGGGSGMGGGLNVALGGGLLGPSTGAGMNGAPVSGLSAGPGPGAAGGGGGSGIQGVGGAGAGGGGGAGLGIGQGGGLAPSAMERTRSLSQRRQIS